MGYQEFNPARHPDVYFALFVEKTEQDAEIVRRVTRVSIRDQDEKAMTASLQIRDETGEIAELGIFGKDTEWTILLGYRTDFQPFGPFKLTSLAFDNAADGVIVITVELMDATHKLAKTTKRRAFESTTLGEVVKQIADEHGMGYQIEDSDKVVFTEDFPLMQAGVSDAQLLRQLATRFGYRFEITDGAIVFKQTQINTDVSTGKVLAWRIGSRNLKSFKPAQQTFGGKGRAGGAAAQAGAKVQGGNVDIEKGADFLYEFAADGAGGLLESLSGGSDEEAEGGEVPPSEDGAPTEASRKAVFDGESGEFRLVDEPAEPAVAHKDVEGDTPQTEDEAKQTASAAKAGSRSAAALASAVLTLGDTSIRKGDWVEVIGVKPNRFAGRWRVARFEHTIDSNGLSTTLGLSKKGLGASSATAAAEDAAGSQEARPQEPQDERTGHRFNGETGEWVPDRSSTSSYSPLDVSFDP